MTRAGSGAPMPRDPVAVPALRDCGVAVSWRYAIAELLLPATGPSPASAPPEQHQPHRRDPPFQGRPLRDRCGRGPIIEFRDTPPDYINVTQDCAGRPTGVK